jgi:uncharacterized protein YndB with AHSA1/START domain
MSKSESGAGRSFDRVVLSVRKTIRATPERLFEAWTHPDQLLNWWGPEGVTCIGAEIDLSVGGRYRIGNQMPDGSKLWITGEFEVIDPPRRLAYTWSLEGIAGPAERVTVRFEPLGGVTEVVVTHERIADEATRDQHERGWIGCLHGLARFVEVPR